MHSVNEIRELMSRNPVCFSVNSKLIDVARAMRDTNIGAVVVTDHDKPVGVTTDRDIVIRAAAEGKSLKTTKVGEICSRNMHSLPASASTRDALTLMREQSVRRVPVMDEGSVVGIVSLGDLAKTLDPRSVLGEISDAPPNH